MSGSNFIHIFLEKDAWKAVIIYSMLCKGCHFDSSFHLYRVRLLIREMEIDIISSKYKRTSCKKEMPLNWGNNDGSTNMTFQELMMKSLTDLLEEEEILKYPIYATLMQRGKHWFGYFGLTDEYLLIALLEGSSQIISWTSRVPLDIKEVKVKKSFIPAQ